MNLTPIPISQNFKCPFCSEALIKTHEMDSYKEIPHYYCEDCVVAGSKQMSHNRPFSLYTLRVVEGITHIPELIGMKACIEESFYIPYQDNLFSVHNYFVEKKTNIVLVEVLNNKPIVLSKPPTASEFLATMSGGLRWVGELIQLPLISEWTYTDKDLDKIKTLVTFS